MRCLASLKGYQTMIIAPMPLKGAGANANSTRIVSSTSGLWSALGAF
ncbi:MAG: hypothetical protein JRE82_10790 [Deltaproteobacteria bacterium]|nr:hypothetical protein [Deltaproteobacteria bacterium]